MKPYFNVAAKSIWAVAWYLLHCIQFSLVARGRKLCVLILVCLGSAFVGLCIFVQVCSRRLLFMVFCRRRDCLSWGYLCPCWGHWPGCEYTVGRRCLPIVPWSWFFMGTLWPDRVPCWTLTIWSGCPPLFVRIPVSLCQRKVCLTLVNLLSFVRWSLFFEALPRPCSLVCHVLLLIMIPVGWWFPPRWAPGRGLWLSATVSLWSFWPHFSVCGMSGKPYQIDGGSHCCGKVICVFCKKIPFLKDACAFVLPFRSIRVLACPHAKEKCACDKLNNVCVQVCVSPLVDVQD